MSRLTLPAPLVPVDLPHHAPAGRQLPGRVFVHNRPHRTRGLATLAILSGLLLAMCLLAAYMARASVFQQRTSAQQVRAVVAFEAAESGQAWALAQLNGLRHIDESCAPTGDTHAPGFRDRALAIDERTWRITPTGWSAACSLSGEGVRCHCPSNVSLPPEPRRAENPAAAFRITMTPSVTDGTMNLRAVGCAGVAPPCAPGDGRPAEARAEVGAVVGWLTALPHRPVAAVTALGSIEARDGARAVNTDAQSGAYTFQSGGHIEIDAEAARGAPGSPSTASLIESEAAFHRPDNTLIDGGAYFALHFGIRPATFKALPGVRVLRCAGTCRAHELQRLAEEEGVAVFWIEGSLAIDEPLALGSTERPVLIVAEGPVHFGGGSTMTGLLYVATDTWVLDAAGGAVRGAVVAQGKLHWRGHFTATHDDRVLRRLAARAGVFASVPGGWHDMTP